jgi:hypothetical protein
MREARTTDELTELPSARVLNESALGPEPGSTGSTGWVGSGDGSTVSVGVGVGVGVGFSSSGTLLGQFFATVLLVRDLAAAFAFVERFA